MVSHQSRELDRLMQPLEGRVLDRFQRLEVATMAQQHQRQLHLEGRVLVRPMQRLVE